LSSGDKDEKELDDDNVNANDPEKRTKKRKKNSKVAKFNLNYDISLDTHLFINVPRSGDNEVTFSVFELSSHLLLPVLSLKRGGNPVKCLTQGHNKQTCCPISTLTL